LAIVLGGRSGAECPGRKATDGAGGGSAEEIGQADNTIIVFAGDNGLALGQHGLMGKQNLYDHSLRVPLIMCGPGIPKGKRSDAFCYLLDIFPTLCDLIGVPIPGSVEGKSLVPAMRDADKIRDTMFFAYTDLHRSVRDERYKLIEYVVGDTRHTQVFDLQEDPFELDNLAGEPEYSEHLSRLRQALVQWKDELGDTREQGQRFWAGYHKQQRIWNEASRTRRNDDIDNTNVFAI